MKKTFLLLSVSLVGALSLPSCNTIVGVGRDIRAVGEGVENKAYGRQWNGKPRTRVTVFDRFKTPAQ